MHAPLAGRLSPCSHLPAAEMAGRPEGCEECRLVLLFWLSLPLHCAASPMKPRYADHREIRDGKNFPATEAIVRELAATGDPTVERPLAALVEGNLYVRKSDGAVFIGDEAGQAVQARRPADRRGRPARRRRPTSTKVKVNNGLRRTIRDLLGHADARVRRSSGPARRRGDDVPQRRTPLRSRLSMRRSPRKPLPASRPDWSRRALRPSSCPTCRKQKSSRRSISSRRRGDREALSLLTGYAASADGALKEAAPQRVIDR